MTTIDTDGPQHDAGAIAKQIRDSLQEQWRTDYQRRKRREIIVQLAGSIASRMPLVGSLMITQSVDTAEAVLAEIEKRHGADW